VLEEGRIGYDWLRLRSYHDVDYIQQTAVQSGCSTDLSGACGSGKRPARLRHPLTGSM
jgi:hypothetical protein